jgi:hypothetical protein
VYVAPAVADPEVMINAKAGLYEVPEVIFWTIGFGDEAGVREQVRSPFAAIPVANWLAEQSAGFAARADAVEALPVRVAVIVEARSTVVRSLPAESASEKLEVKFRFDLCVCAEVFAWTVWYLSVGVPET